MKTDQIISLLSRLAEALENPTSHSEEENEGLLETIRLTILSLNSEISHELWEGLGVRMVNFEGIIFTRWDYKGKTVVHSPSLDKFLCSQNGQTIHEMDSLRSALYWLAGDKSTGG